MVAVSEWASLPLVLTTEQVAALLHLHVNTVKNLCRQGKLPATKIGNVWRFQRADILPLLAAPNGAVAGAGQPTTPPDGKPGREIPARGARGADYL
jgi:excisionase family DNA binding protein